MHIPDVTRNYYKILGKSAAGSAAELDATNKKLYACKNPFFNHLLRSLSLHFECVTIRMFFDVRLFPD